MMVLPEVHVGRGSMLDMLTVFPVWSGGTAPDGLATGSSARVTVSELMGGPSVEALQVENSNDWPVLLLEGELLEGGWQSRALVRDVIVGANAAILVEVACVEQRRWSGHVIHERFARRATPRVQQALRGHASNRQQKVWANVNSYESTIGQTKTSSLGDQLDLLTAAAAYTPLEGQSGVLIGLAGQPLALELFGSSSALNEHLPAIINAARLDAASLQVPAIPVPARRARRMLERFDLMRLNPQPEFVGDGCSIGAMTPDLVARGIFTRDGRIAHLSVLYSRHPMMASSL